MSAASNFARPVGFRPSEISAMINQQVVDQHADEAAFLWTQRDHATRAPQYRLKDLAKLDERVEAHLDGLRVAGNAGWITALSQLDQGRGEVFASAVLAFGSDDSDRVKAVLDAACSAARLADGLISALGWTLPGLAAPQARSLLVSQDPEVRRCGIAGLAVHRIDPGVSLTAAISDPNERLSARAMKAAAELGRVDLLPDVLARITDDNEECRFWAAWSAVRLGQRGSGGAIAALREVTEAAGRFALPAMDIVLRTMSVEDAHEWRRHLAGQPAASSLAVVAVGTIGDPAAIPELIAAMDDPRQARVAGGMLSMITGADLGLEHLEGDAPSDDDEAASNDDSDHPFPAPGAVANWWANRSTAYSSGFRYLAGKPITDQSLQEVLIAGRQNQRMAAALELALRRPPEIVFEIRERAQGQQKKVRRWNS